MMDTAVEVFPDLEDHQNSYHFDRILEVSLRKFIGKSEAIEPNSRYWNASTFQLDKVDLFNKLPDALKAEVLSRCSDNLLRETCFIEIAGLSYAARMSLESSRLEEKLFYSLMASEEAQHFSLLKPFVRKEVLDLGPDLFTSYIGEIISTADREDAIFLIQTLLEGWGLHHFTWMARECIKPELKKIFQAITRDEARHHAAGLYLVKKKIGTGDIKVLNCLKQIFSSAKSGPILIYNCLSEVADVRVPKEFIFEQMNSRVETQKKMIFLKRLIAPSLTDQALASLEAEGFLDPA